MSRRLQAALSACAILALLAGWTATASAQVVRPFTSRFTASMSGDLTFVANTLLTCSGGGCASAQGGGNADNDGFGMVHVDVDGDPATFNSSEATLTLPAGATVAWAGLYWGASSSSLARGTCRFTRPGGGGGAVTATQLDAQGAVYSAFVEVTAQVRAAGSGTYRVANVQADTGVGKHAGWTLVVVYELASEPLRWLTVRDGFANVTSAATAVSIPLSGFVIPSSGQVRRLMGALVYDGDAGQNGDRFQLNGVSQGDGTSSSSNAFNSSIALLGNHFTAKTPNYVNQLGLDADLIRVTGILPGGSSSQTLTFTTNGDAYWAAAALFAIDMYAPVIEGSGFTKSATDVDGVPARPGDLLDYTIVLRNTGNDTATQAVMRDTLPANVSYVANSLVVVDGPNAGAKTDAAGDDQVEYVSGSRSDRRAPGNRRDGVGRRHAHGGDADDRAVPRAHRPADAERDRDREPGVRVVHRGAVRLGVRHPQRRRRGDDRDPADDDAGRGDDPLGDDLRGRELRRRRGPLARRRRGRGAPGRARRAVLGQRGVRRRDDDGRDRALGVRRLGPGDVHGRAWSAPA